MAATFCLAVSLALCFFHLSDSFILPLKKSDGTLDTEHLVGHVTLLEQTVASFQQTARLQNTDITTLKNEITHLTALVQTNQQIISNQNADVAVLKSEISNLKASQKLLSAANIATLSTELSTLKANQKKLHMKIADLQNLHMHIWPTTGEGSLQNVLNTVKTEVQNVSNEVVSLTAKFNNLTFAKLPDQNITGTIHDLQESLGRVKAQVLNERFLLQNHMHIFNRTVSELNTKLNASSSAKNGNLNTEVGFECWLLSSAEAPSGGTVRFGNIKYNIGNGYSAKTGIFTAPVSGTYLFWTQLRKTTTGTLIDLYIYKGTTAIGYSYSLTRGPTTSTVITAARVTAGENVYVKMSGADSVFNGSGTSFGGTLLYRH